MATAGTGARGGTGFLLWKGASGRTYVFSPASDPADFADAVVAVEERYGRFGRPFATVAGRSTEGRTLWVHLLARDAAARAAAVGDLALGGRAPAFFAPAEERRDLAA